MLKESGTDAISGVQLLTPANLLKTEGREEKEATPLKLVHLLERERESFPIYRDMFVYPAFISEILSFARECALYGIRAQDLPEEGAAQKELRGIVALALELPLAEKETAVQYQKLLSDAAKLENPEMHVRFEADPFRAKFLKELKTIFGESCVKTERRIPSFQQLRSAKSVRQEAEAAAQEIVRRNQPCGVVLCSYGSTIHVVEQVFRRYGIPISSLHTPQYPSAVRVYCALARFALNKDVPSLLDALSLNAFPAFCSPQLLTWLRQTLTDIRYAPVSPAIETEMMEHDRRKAERFDSQAETFFSSIQAYMDQLTASASPKDALRNAYDVYRNLPLFADEMELQAGMAVMNVLRETLDLVESESDAVFVLRQMEGKAFRKDSPSSEFCVITDLCHPCPVCETLYVLGCTARDYPGVPVRRGLFDEAYAASIPSYPPLQERHDLYHSELSWLEESSDRLIWSYALSDYQGREIQPAFAVTSRVSDTAVWQLETVAPLPPRRHVLEADTAMRLYTDEADHLIHSSISRIERYFLCPYSWFLQSGLKERKPMDSERSASTFGELMHAVFEHAVNTLGKQYTDFSEEDLQAFLAPAFASLRALHPHEEAELSLSRQRMVDAVLETMRILRPAEEAGPIWTPQGAEIRFDERITEHVQLNGIIDRMDVSPSSLRILDYKSSGKSLSEGKVKAGIQLQLLSYLIIGTMLQEKKPSGAYYISMKPASTPVPAGKFKTTNKNGVEMNDVRDPSTLDEYECSTRRIAGWRFSDPHIDPVFYEQFFIPGKGFFNYDVVQEAILELYEQFYHGAVSGRIAVRPVTGACMFCDYRAICRFHGQEEKPAPLVKAGESFKQGKGKAS